MKPDQVTINLGNKDNPPINVIKLENNNPVRNNFRFIPKYNPSLSVYMDTVSWDCISKTLHVVARETPALDVFSWFSTINDRHSEMQKSAFSDMEQDAIFFAFMDADNKCVAKFKFKCIRLMKHNVTVSSIDEDGVLKHEITISYQDVSRIAEDKNEPSCKEADNEADQEWTTYVTTDR